VGAWDCGTLHCPRLNKIKIYNNEVFADETNQSVFAATAVEDPLLLGLLPSIAEFALHTFARAPDYDQSAWMTKL
jgi:hypothetical protein